MTKNMVTRPKGRNGQGFGFPGTRHDAGPGHRKWMGGTPNDPAVNVYGTLSREIYFLFSVGFSVLPEGENVGAFNSDLPPPGGISGPLFGSATGPVSIVSPHPT